MISEQDQVIIYTDGGCVPNPGIGGWGSVIKFKGKRKELSGGHPDTTNNRMELTAAVESLTILTKECNIVIFTDSQYLKNGVTSWMAGWKRKGWKRKGGELKNIDLWKQLDQLVTKHSIEWKWVRGHTGVPENERCDELASIQIDRIKHTA